MASKILGYCGQLLDIDLTSKSVKTVDLDPKLAREFLGGRAMGGKMLLDAYGTNWAKIDPLGPEALLLIMSAPFAGFIGSKGNAVFKSPQSGSIVGAQASADFHVELRFSGYDGIILRGKASSPVYITIFDDKVEIKDASKMWGKQITETHKMITDEYGAETSQYYIGPGGENLVKFAAIMTEWYRSAARGGPGAVMGSKNLKAIICKGTGPAPEVADQKKLFELIKWGRENLHLINKGSHEYGTVPGILNTGMRGSSEPVKNWYSEWHDHQEVSAFQFAAEHWIRRYWSDYGCTVACSKLGRVKYGKRAGTMFECPDYEGGALQGTNYGIFDTSEMAYSSTRPDELGLDLIALGNVCSFACEAVEKGILKKEDLGGIDLKWGDTDAFAQLSDLIAFRKGEIPTLLGEGVHVAAKKIGKGSEKFAIHIKGIEPGAHGVRSSKEGSGSINYAVATQGGDHCSVVRSTAGTEGEAGFINDSISMCGFQGLTRDQQAEWLQAITGFGITKDDLEKTLVKRCTTMQRITNLLAGWTHEDDVNPPRWYDPLPEGPQKGMKIEKSIEQKMLQNYYDKLGWDKQGVPTTATLQQYGFEAFDSSMAPLRAKA